jgi:hypothetical protein
MHPERLTAAQLNCVDLEAERTPCTWETEEETTGGNLVDLERAKIIPVLVVDDDESTASP